MTSNSNIQPFDDPDILPIVLEFLEDYDPELVEHLNATKDFDMLLGTCYWTFIRLTDNYLIGKLNPNVYQILLEMDQHFSPKNLSLPDEPNNSEQYNLQFFKFSLNIRPNLSAKDKKNILKNVKNRGIKKIEVGSESKDSLMSFASNYIEHLQEYELRQITSDEELVYSQIHQNGKLLQSYLLSRPNIFRSLN